MIDTPPALSSLVRSHWIIWRVTSHSSV